MFKLARMERLSVTNTANTRQHTLAEAMEEHNDTKEYENGDFEYSFTVPEYETFWYGVVLSCGANLNVLAPERVKERILTTCRAIIKEYGGK